MPRKRDNPNAEAMPDLTPEMISWPMTMGNHFREARLANGFSLREVERLTGITDTELHKIETGSHECRLSSFIRLCVALGMPSGRMLDDTITGSWAFYAGAIRKNKESLHILTLFGADEKTFEPVIANLASCCAFAAHLLRCAFARRKAFKMEYPSKDLREAYLQFALSVDAIEENLERVSILKALRDHPLSELKQQKLFSEPFVRKLILETHEALTHPASAMTPKELKHKKRIGIWAPWIPK
jgi:transcriptional regulator with XRE-family HTH domain